MQIYVDISGTDCELHFPRLVVEDSLSVSPRLERILARFDPLNRLILAGKLGIEGNGDKIGIYILVRKYIMKFGE